MRVEVRLFATLSSFLPPDSGAGAGLLNLPEGSTVRDLARCLGVPADFERVSLVNGHESTPDTILHPDDVITLFPPLSGG